MSDFEIAARPYARAIFELAVDEGKLQAWQDKVELAASIAADDGRTAESLARERNHDEVVPHLTRKP